MNIRNVLITTLISLSPLQLCGMNNNTINSYNQDRTKSNGSLPPLLPNPGSNNINILKRTSETNITSPSPDKKTRMESPQESESLILFPKATQGDPLSNNALENERMMQIDPITVKPQNIALQLSPHTLSIKKLIYNIDPIALDNLLVNNGTIQLSKEEKEDLYKSAKEQKKLIKTIHDIGNTIASQTDSQEIKTKFLCDSEYKNIQKITHNLYALKTLPKLTFPQAFFTNAQRYRDAHQNQTPDQALLTLIKNEQEKISICCYHFDLENIAAKLICKKNKGIIVEVLTDQRQKNLKAINLLVNNGISVSAPQNDSYEMNHHKFTLFKRNLFNKTLLCHGSFNYTDSAIQRNWEDMTISDDFDMIAQFEQQFEDVKNCSSQPKFLENVKK